MFIRQNIYHYKVTWIVHGQLKEILINKTQAYVSLWLLHFLCCMTLSLFQDYYFGCTVVPSPNWMTLYFSAMITTQYFPQLISLTNIGSVPSLQIRFRRYSPVNRVYFKPSEFFILQRWPLEFHWGRIVFIIYAGQVKGQIC